MGLENWYQLGAFGVIAVILCVVLMQQGKRYDKLIDNIVDVVRTNTAAMTSMENALNGLPDFVRQVDRRLQNGKRLFDEHAKRIEQLEQKE